MWGNHNVMLGHLLAITINSKTLIAKHLDYNAGFIHVHQLVVLVVQSWVNSNSQIQTHTVQPIVLVSEFLHSCSF